MSVETYVAPDSIEPFDDQEAIVSYDLDKERWLALAVEARVALAIAEIEALQAPFEDPKKITQALVAATLLDVKTVRATNLTLFQKGYLDRAGFAKPGETPKLSLSLNESGYLFLEEAIKKVQ